jgi:molybdopterin/thiamine biosynthesis adenylyltransferase/rhodanese-related sulfurtransferase
MVRQGAERDPATVDLDAFPVILDLRDGDVDDVIPGSVRVDRLDFTAMAESIGGGGTPALLYCGIGEASRIAARELRARGFTGVVSLAGGIRRWRAQGFPVVARRSPAGRYERHLQLADFGREGQDRMRSASVVVVGAGGLGSPTILYLAASGVGALTIVDGDTVEVTNLHRQVLFDDGSIGAQKAEAAASRVTVLNPDVDVVAVPAWLDDRSAYGIVTGHDLVIDASDNFATRLALSDAAARAGSVLVHGAAIRWDGLVAVLDPRTGPCYRCLFPNLEEAEESCSAVGVLGGVTGVIGSIMAVEATKHLIGSPDRRTGRLITYDGRSGRFDVLSVEASTDCPLGHPRPR